MCRTGFYLKTVTLYIQIYIHILYIYKIYIYVIYVCVYACAVYP